MDRHVEVPVEQFLQQMQADFEEAMRQVAQAVNQAPDGHWINASEIPVREVMAEFRRKAYQTALQMRIDAAEGTFSPGASRDGQADAEQGAR